MSDDNLHWSPALAEVAQQLVATALREDLATGRDLTSCALIPDTATGTVNLVSRETGVLSGLPVAMQVFTAVDERLRVKASKRDGDAIRAGDVVAQISGPMRSLLTAERTALNFLTLLSGTASLTQQFVAAVAGTSAAILDTRKTLPGLRALQKYAVRCGGGQNHRIGLYDAVLVKDNHLGWWSDSAGKSLRDVVAQVRQSVPPQVLVEVEVDSLAQLGEIVTAAPEIVLLDNMSLDDLRKAVAIRDEVAPQVLLEASGGVNLRTVRGIAETGVDRISIGALTHSAPALDLALDWSQARPTVRP